MFTSLGAVLLKIGKGIESCFGNHISTVEEYSSTSSFYFRAKSVCQV